VGLRRSRRGLAVGALLALVLVWSSTFVATKLLFGQIGPVGLALLRFVVATAILVPLADWRGAGPLPWGRLALLGLTGVTGYYVFQNVGLVYTSASAASLILACIPALVAGVAALFLKEKLNARRLAGVGASVVGVAAIVVAGKPEPSAPAPLVGDALLLGSALAWTAYTTLGKGLEHLSFRVTSAASVGFGALFLLPLAGAEYLSRGAPALTPAGWLGVLYLGAAASAAAYYLWAYALQTLDATEATVYLNLIPLLGVALAAATLGESVGVLELVGGALIVGGVTFAGRAPAREAEEELLPLSARGEGAGG